MLQVYIIIAIYGLAEKKESYRYDIIYFVSSIEMKLNILILCDTTKVGDSHVQVILAYSIVKLHTT